MEGSIFSSPERGPLVTYKDRKRKRTISAQTDSDSDSSQDSKHTTSAKSNLGKSDIKPTSKKAKVRNSNIPAPSPKEIPRSRTSLEKAKTKLHVKHVRGASSVCSLKQVTEMTPSGKKPESKGKSVNDDDDNASVADSALGTGRIRRNESERIQYFVNQPECGKMEAHQVHCLRCNKAVNLGRKQTYAVRPWEIHRARCDQRPVHTVVLATSDNKVESSPTSESARPAEARPASQPTPARRPSEQERKEFLESDGQIEKVEKDRVLCRKCQIWVDLGQNSSYATGHWVKHKVRCSAAKPSNRVTAAKRRIVLVNDAQVKSFDAKSVKCTLCSTKVLLDGEGDFNLVKWNEHKASCTKPAPILKNDSVNSISFPSLPCRPPLSSASTEDTLVVDAGPSRPVQGLKQSREESDHHLPDEDMPKPLRPRTDSYLPPVMEPPNSILGWFMMPIHSFVRGFKESLRDQS